MPPVDGSVAPLLFSTLRSTPAAEVLTEGVKAAVFLQELEPLRFRVSMRTNGEVNAAEVCSFYGGGGHDRAAGCTISATWRDAVNNLAQSIEMQLKKGEASPEENRQI